MTVETSRDALTQLQSMEEGAGICAASAGPVDVIQAESWGRALQAEGQECAKSLSQRVWVRRTAGSSSGQSVVGKV